MPRTAPISWASSGKARPEKSMRDLRFSAVMLPMAVPLQSRGLASFLARRRLVAYPTGAVVAFFTLRGRCFFRRVRGRTAGPLALHPAFDVALLGARHSERAGRNVLDDDAAGRGVRTVTDGHRRDEHVVRAGPRVG